MNVCVSSDGTEQWPDLWQNRPLGPGEARRHHPDRGETRPRRGGQAAETGGKEISGFLKYYVGSPSSPSRVGGIELDYGDEEAEYLPAFRVERPAVVRRQQRHPERTLPGDEYQGTKPPPVVRFKEPFLISTFQLKTERDSKFPSRGWIHNSPVNLYASEGLDQKEPWADHQYELQWEAMTDWPPASPTIEISNTKNRGYGGPGIYAQSGLEFATHSSIPLAPALSLGPVAACSAQYRRPAAAGLPDRRRTRSLHPFSDPAADPQARTGTGPCWTIPFTRTPRFSTNTSSPALPNPAARSTARPPSRTPSAACLTKAPRSRNPRFIPYRGARQRRRNLRRAHRPGRLSQNRRAPAHRLAFQRQQHPRRCLGGVSRQHLRQRGSADPRMADLISATGDDSAVSPPPAEQRCRA